MTKEGDQQMKKEGDQQKEEGDQQKKEGGQTFWGQVIPDVM